MIRAALASALAVTTACTPVFGDAPERRDALVCPSGYVTDAVREARLAAIVAGAADAGVAPSTARLVSPICFGPARSLGVLAGPRVVLRASASDEELAGRVAHLAVHLEDDLGDGCRHGLARALASEEHAHAVETAVRAHLQLPPLADEEGEAAKDYARRCASP